MNIYHQNDRFTLYEGDALVTLREMPSNSVSCAITSPPYHGLRAYGTNPQIWGGSEECEHEWGEKNIFCQKCDAVKCELGSEPTFDLYIQNLVLIFEEVRRVLHPKGCLFLNIGDSYAANRTYQVNQTIHNGRDVGNHAARRVPKGLKSKDLIGQPWSLAFALRDAGWYLRNDCIWEKVNCAPESVKDRFTRSHEYMFFLTKSNNYYFDAFAVREPAAESTLNDSRLGASGTGRSRYDDRQNGACPTGMAGGAADGWRNKRTVWSIPTESSREKHFASFAQDLVKPCVMAGSSEKGICSKCGAPYKRIIAKGESNEEWKRACGADKNGRYTGIATKDYASAKAQNASALKARILEGMRVQYTAGWKVGCQCTEDIIPATVLDPFSGTSTTGVVAISLGRHYIGIELNPKYCKISKKRLLGAPPPLPGMEEYIFEQQGEALEEEKHRKPEKVKAQQSFIFEE